MAELDYAPQWSGRALRKQRTGLLATVTYSPLTPWAEDLLTQLHAVALEHGLDVVILRYTAPDEVLRHLRLLQRGLADAVLVLGFDQLAPEHQEGFARLQCPVLAHAFDGPDGLSYLRQHEQAAIREALALLAASGTRSLHFVWDTNHATAPDREHIRARWMREELARAWPDIAVGPVQHLDGAHPTHAAAGAILDDVVRSPSPSLLCSSDRSAVPLLWAASQRGLRVPDDLRVIGMGNIMMGQMSYPALTTLGMVDPDYTNALEHLVARIEDPDIKPANFDLPWELIRRGSA